MDANAQFSLLMGIAGKDNNSTNKGDRIYISPDTIKLPGLQKPPWMEELEVGLLGASPPIIGKQATRLTRRGEGMMAFQKLKYKPP